MTAGMLQALIFDVDGTLADTEANGHRVAYNRAFHEAGLNWHWSEEYYGRLLAISGGRERLRFYLGTRIRNNEPLTLENPDEFIENLYQRKTRHFISIAEAGRLLPRPGVYRIILQAQKAGLVLAIASSTDEKNVRALLRCSFDRNIEHWFEYIAAGETVDKKKPAPDIYHQVLKALHLDAMQCLAFEDSAAGLGAACAARIPTIVTWNSYTRNDDFSDAARTVEHLDKSCDLSDLEYGKKRPAAEQALDLHALSCIHADCVRQAMSY
jgi:HAD superfamily hydrolase (TIGR01509 family)